MKANESVKNYAASVRMYTNYTVREIKKMCKEIGPRPSGSESEKKAQEYITEQMKTCADEVTMEPFKLAPDAFMAWVRMDGILILISVIFAMLKIPVVSMVLTAIALAFCIGEFLLYKPFYDCAFPKKYSHNVIGVKKATGELKQRIIFSGHVDSSYEWRYTYLGGAPMLYGCGATAVISLFVILIVSALNTFGVLEEGTTIYSVLFYAQLLGIPGGILAILCALAAATNPVLNLLESKKIIKIK